MTTQLPLPILPSILKYDILANFSDFTIDPSIPGTDIGRINFIAKTWDYGPLDGLIAPATRKMIFTAKYTGAAMTSANVLYNLSFAGTYVSLLGKDVNYSGTLPDELADLAACQPTTPPCCEDCSYNDYPYTPCQHYQDAYEEIQLESTGRVLAVHLNLPAVCDTRDVNVGVFVNEVHYDANGNEINETPHAFKVIRKTATGTTNTCQDDRDCKCVHFLIDEDGARCGSRTFRVRTTAHYVAESSNCQCSCNMNTR